MNSMESLGYDAAHQQAEYIFRTVLPACGMTVREGQIQLCHAMLDSLYNKEVTLCDAGVGLGKTYAYLIACLLWQWQRPREQWQPVVISTASVTLQDALLQQYIPFLSNALIQYGYIDEPAHAVLRKGKERFVCDARLEERRMQIAQRGEAFARRAALLRAADRYLDLDRVAGLSRYDRQHICVPNRCDRQCGAWESCRYRQYVRASNGPTITIQICNHNYLLADAVHRQKGWNPLLRDYQALIIDEAHCLPDAAQQMATRRLSVQKLTQLAEQLARAHHPYAAQQVQTQTRALAAACILNAPAEGKPRRAFAITDASATALAGMQKVVTQILEREHTRLPHHLQNQLAETKELAGRFARPDDSMIRYIEIAENGESVSLCAVPRDLPSQLYDLLWKREKPAILTSGTLAAGRDFDYTARRMGLRDGVPVNTLQVPSPFDYPRNAMLYFPLRPDVGNCSKEAQNERVAGQIESLVRSACGHTLVLFTSYDQMGHVYEQLEGRLSYPMHKDRYKLADGTIREKVQPKYNCFQRAQKNKGGRDCDGQSLYLAETVDAIVLEVVRKVFAQIKDTPYSRVAEQRIRQESNLQKVKRAAIEKKMRSAQHALERFEGEILKCLDGTSCFTEDMIAKQIRKSQKDLDDAKAEFAELQKERINEAAEIRKLRSYYDDFRGWADEFDSAPLEIKRTILSQLIDRVEVGRKYAVTIKFNMSYQQFLKCDNTIEPRQEIGA